jgi:diguanylate cyclase (GGDEF)-like protein/PAS domain S-box-containing protein
VNKINGVIFMTLNDEKFLIESSGGKGNLTNSFPSTISILDNLSSGFFIIDSNWVITYLNKSMENWVGKKRENLVGYNIWNVLPDAIETNIYYLYHKVVEEQIPVIFENYYERTQVWLKVTVEPYNKGIIGYVTNITDYKKNEQTIKHITFHGYLTGLPNRKMLNLRLSNELTIASEKEQNLALLLIDLDRLRLINDTLGNNVGDLLLKEVTKRLETSVSNQDIIFRQGGDEFIVILADSDRHEAIKVARRILGIFTNPFLIEGNKIFTSLNMGISYFPDDGETVEKLIKHANFAMYQAKKRGRNNYEFYSSHYHEVKINPLEIEMELHKAIEYDQFLLHYQPKVNLKTGTIIGVEALIRWTHPKWGMISPGTFIPIAEETGLIIPIGECCLYAACKQNIEWQKQGFSTVVSVNLSPRQFNQSNIVKTIETVLQKTGLEPHYLEIEITESTTCDIEHTILTLQQLKKLGVRISIDDFGTGFSSLNYLKKFSVDTLKIDLSFVRELHNNPNDETIVKTIISMAHNLNLNVVAEGIETKEQLVFLQQNLCDEGQGYLFSKPLPAVTLVEKLSKIQKIVSEHGISQDSNERMWLKELLSSAEKELQDTVRLQQGMIFKFKKINDRFIHTLCDGELMYRFGMITAQVVGKGLHDFLPIQNAISKTIYYQRAWEGEEFVSYEAELNGIHYLAILRPIKKGGEVIEVIGSCVDITARRIAEKALQESESKYRLIAENMTDIIMLLDSNGMVIYASQSLYTVLGILSKSYLGKGLFDFINPEDKLRVMNQFEQMLKTRSPSQMEARFLHSNGTWLLIEGVVTPVVGENGEIEHCIMVGRDITEKRKAEELLSKSEKLAVVGELAAGVAHEIRNPMTTIKGFIQLFQQGIIKQEFLDIIFSEFNRIEDILKEFINLAKPQDIQLKLANLKTILKDVETLLESEANLKNVQIHQECLQQQLPQIMCDVNQLKQVFINLVKNSIEAITNRGFINIQASIEKENVLIKIEDNGIGISEERLKRLGEPFFSNKEKGTGLGLMLCFRIISQHNGTITVKSIENKGTTVEVRLPIS